MRDLSFLSTLDAVAQAELVARGELSAHELLDACEARIAALDPLLHTTVTLAIDHARALPPRSGPLGGVPFLVKDVTPYPGLRWSMGSRSMAQNVAPVGTPFTQRIDEAGLVTIGKSATSEFGLLGSTETFLEGVTHNPWDLSYSAAGSSGGAAAAVAAGLVPLAHANDGGGSIRVPASVCGVFGFKPSRGRCVSAMLAASDYGDLTSDLCISRSVRDTALFLSLVEASEGPFAPVGYVRAPSSKRLRIGAWSRTMLGHDAEPEVRRAFDDARSLVASLGHEVVEIAPPPVDGAALRDAFFLVAGAAISGVAEMVMNMTGRPVERHAFEPFTWALVEEYRRGGAPALDRARAALRECAGVYLEGTKSYDAVMTPTLSTRPWRIGHLAPILSRDEALDRTARTVGYTPIQNAAGCPAMSVPLHWTDDGLPIGTHFAAAPGAEASLLALAYELEAARSWHNRWAPYSYPRLFMPG